MINLSFVIIQFTYYFETPHLPLEGEGQGKGDNFTPTFILPPQGGGNWNRVSRIHLG